MKDESTHQQEGHDLGEKMLHAFSQVLKQHDQGVIIGTDCPYLNASHLHQAFERINTADVVIGPAKDGGYYLLGMKTAHHSLFEKMDWGTDKVYSRTRERTSEKGLSVELLPELADIDYERDWIEYQQWKDMNAAG